MPKKLVFVVALTAALVSQSTAAQPSAPRYRLVDLGAATGCKESTALAVNRSGSVLVRDIGGHYRTLIWRPGAERPEDGTSTEIELPEARQFLAMGLNDYG